MRLTYVTTVEGEPKLGEEHTEFGWFTLEEMKNLEDLDIYLKELLSRDILGGA